jgi:hypothetical protein
MESPVGLLYVREALAEGEKLIWWAVTLWITLIKIRSTSECIDMSDLSTSMCVGSIFALEFISINK